MQATIAPSQKLCYTSMTDKKAQKDAKAKKKRLIARKKAQPN